MALTSLVVPLQTNQIQAKLPSKGPLLSLSTEENSQLLRVVQFNGDNQIISLDNIGTKAIIIQESIHVKFLTITHRI
jgi:hypothetical protein